MTPPPIATRPKVLIVEDEQAIARCLATFLNARGFDAVVAPDATVASGLLAVQRWDVLVLDQLLGRGPRGDEVLDAAARSDPGIRSRTIFMTGDITPETDARIRLSGCHHRLAKPFSLTLLLDLVREVVDGPTTPAVDRRQA